MSFSSSWSVLATRPFPHALLARPLRESGDVTVVQVDDDKLSITSQVRCGKISCENCGINIASCPASVASTPSTLQRRQGFERRHMIPIIVALFTPYVPPVTASWTNKRCLGSS